MKKSSYNPFSLLFLLVVMIATTTLSAKNYTKEVLRNFTVNADAKLYITNGRGKVNITTWDKNTIKVETKIIVNAKDPAQAEAFFKQIKINFEKNIAYVKVTTVKEKEKESWTDWLLGAAQNLDWQVEYNIVMPKTNRLSAMNKFGDVYVSGVKGDVSLDLKYGNFKLSNIPDLKCDLSYGDGTISEIQHLEIDIKYCDLKLRSTKSIDIVSKHSKIDIDAAADIRSNSKYDDFVIGSVKQLNSTGRYDDFLIGRVGAITAIGKNSDFKIESILESGDFKLEYGEVIIDNLSTSLEKLKLIGEYTEFIVDTEGGTFNLVVSSDATEVNTPKAMDKTSEKKENNILKIEGKIGKGNSNALIEVRTKYGSLKIIER